MEVLQRLSDTDAPRPEVVLVTGAGNEKIAVTAMRQGAGDYLVKDTEGRYLEMLPRVIERVLEHRALQELGGVCAPWLATGEVSQ